MVRVGIYVRVSTVEQYEKGYSIEAQIKELEEKCIKEGKLIVKKYIDKGISGKSMCNRQALQKLLSDSKNNVFDEVWVWKTNRLTRNHLDLLTIVKELEENRIVFKSLNEPYDTSTIPGKLMMHMLSSFAEFERENIVDNVKFGMKERARKGKWNGGVVLGYRSVSDVYNIEKTKLEIIEEEAEIVKKIFNLYAEGKGFKAILNIINDEGLRTKKGNLFSISSIKEIITNPLYVGKIRYNVRENWSQNRRKILNKNPIICEGEHKEIISTDLWEKVQSVYKEKSKKPSRVFCGSYPLTGILKCPECGGSMVAGRVSKKRKDGTKYIIRYYQCSEWKNRGKSACKPNSIRADVIEKHVFSKIGLVFNNDKLIDKIEGGEIIRLEDKEREIRVLTNKIKKLNLSITKQFELYEDDRMKKELVTKRILDLQEDIDKSTHRKNELEESISNLNKVEIDRNEIKSLMKDFYDVLAKVEDDKKKVLLNCVINKILIRDKGNIEKIEIKMNSGVKRHLSNEEEESDEMDSSSFYFVIEI